MSEIVFSSLREARLALIMNQDKPQKPVEIDFANPEPRSPDDERAPLLSSHALDWENVNFDFFRYGNCETSVHVLKHHTIGSILDRGKVERKLDGVYRLESATRGSVTIIPAGVEHWSAWNIIGRFAMISVAPGAIAQIDPDVVNPDLVELVPAFAKSKPDRLIYGVSLAIKHHLETNPNDGGFYVEHLTNTICAHLLRHYCTRKIIFKDYAGGLATTKLEQAKDYINDNLETNIQLKDIAKKLDISQYYFSHLFRKSTGISPYSYVIQQRVAKAQRLLINTSMSIAEIALACGFSSQSQLTIHFRKFTGTTPKKYRDSSR